jgi:hypothetical protein
VTQCQDLDVTREVVTLVALTQQTQQAANGEVEKRQQHRALQEKTDREPAMLLDEAAQANVSRVCEPLTLTLETVPVGALALDPANARKHGSRNLDAIAGSLRQFGQRRPLVCRRAGEQTMVIAGNGTLEAALSLGWTEIVITVVPDDWTPEQAKAYALADNRTAELATWDEGVLQGQLASLDELGFDLKSIGFDGLPSLDLSEGADDVPEVPLAPVSAPGDLWVCGPHRVACESRTDFLFRCAEAACVARTVPRPSWSGRTCGVTADRLSWIMNRGMARARFGPRRHGVDTSWTTSAALRLYAGCGDRRSTKDYPTCNGRLPRWGGRLSARVEGSGRQPRYRSWLAASVLAARRGY